MRLLLVPSFSAACGGNAKPAATTQPADLASLISDDAVGVVRQPAEQFPVLVYSRDIAKSDEGIVAPCWTSLEQRVTAGYQISLPAGSYFVLEGDLPRTEVESCMESATAGLVTSDKAPSVAGFETPSGTVFAAWRSPYVVLGTRAQVDAAIKPHAADKLARWGTLFTATQAAPVWMLRTDRAFDDLLGAPTTSFLLILDKLEPSTSFLAGRIIVRYASEDDAAAGERFVKAWIAAGKFPRAIPGPSEVVALYDQLAGALQRVRLTRTNGTLEVTFDSTMFGNMMEHVMKAATALGS